MGKGRHHFVPKLYLKAFQSAPKRIHLHNLNTSLPVKHASLRDQCYRRKFYGQTDQVEDALASMENSTAPLLQSIVAHKVLPTIGTAAYETLVAFVGLQLLRTTIAARRIDSGADKMIKQAYAGDPRLAGLDMESVHVGYQDPVLASLRSLPDFVNAISDLHGHLVVSSTPSFLTSDNPAFKYNQYCEEIRYMGITGGLSRGLQIFMPLAPYIQLVLYDSAVYRVNTTRRRSRVSTASQSDLDKLNAMQLIAAEQNVYFSDWRQSEDVRRLVPTVAGHRTADPMVVEYGQDNDFHSSLLHTFERTPCLKLKLSFLRVKTRARAIPLQARAQGHRKEMPMPPLPEPPNLKGQNVRFSRFIGRR